MTSHKLITFTDWASGEPADFLNQDCLDIKGSVHYHWNDSPCSYLHWFICEKHVYVLQLLTLIIVRVLYLKLKKKKYSISALGFCDFVQNSWKIFSFCQYVGNFPNINDKYRSTLEKNGVSNIVLGYNHKLHFKMVFLCLPEFFILWCVFYLHLR